MDAVATNYVPEARVAARASERVISLLKATYGVVPIVAGADKFTHLLTDWNQYLAPAVVELLPVSAGAFMSVVGVVEIVAGVLVLTRPRIGSLVVGCWLLAIALNLLLSGQYLDVAVRDAVMAIGAFSLFMLLKGREQEGIADK
jgi:uncharacterized membrane protein YphA (DoxX/SURF4 family)